MKKKITILVITLVTIFTLQAQTKSIYEISFENAVHHEAEVKATFSNLENKVLTLSMSRSSPGRYALHEFAKNVYNVKATDGKGNSLKITRPNPYQWNIADHDGTVNLSYTLFANHGDGTYSQIDESHAHLNMPATFMYAQDYQNLPIQVTFHARKDLNWKVATQLKPVKGDTFYAPNLQYFMDSPTEISNHEVRSFEVDNNGKKLTINFALHHQGTTAELDAYFENVKKIVLAEKAVYGELPNFDYGQYTFLACYMPQVGGDGMEHRNSTILTTTNSLAQGGGIGTVSHEFFHAWNVERIRPETLEPFNFNKTNMSGELWFAEGFTSYYTNLILCRAGIITPEKYINGLAGTLNYVWNSPARKYYNPIEMSYQAPFVDAARSVDPVNRENTFISYYSYGSVLGLALDLSLRKEDKNLDDFMKLVWQKYGKTEIAYTIRDIQNALANYAGVEFANRFFDNYIFHSKMPNYKDLFASVGVDFTQDKLNQASFGASVSNKNGKYIIANNPYENGAAYVGGLSQNDEIISFNQITINETNSFTSILQQLKPNQKVKIKFKRFGEVKETEVTLGSNPSYTTSLMEKVSKKVIQKREAWLR